MSANMLVRCSLFSCRRRLEAPKLVLLGAAADPLEVPAVLLIGGRGSVVGWPSGTSIDSQDTLAFSLLAGVRAMTEVFPLERAADAFQHVMSGNARFPVVLTTSANEP